MAMNDTDLAEEIKDSLGFTPLPLSAENEGLATAIVNHISTGLVNFVPGTINGTCADGSPISGATAVGGLITLAPTLPAFIAELVGVFGVSTPEIVGLATAISTHVELLGLVDFGSGTIAGPCAGGTWVGEATGGTISGLDGAVLGTLMASLMAKPFTSPELESMATAIVDHIQNNAEVSFASGTMTGSYPSPAGGPLAGGTGVGGTIT